MKVTQKIKGLYFPKDTYWRILFISVFLVLDVILASRLSITVLSEQPLSLVTIIGFGVALLLFRRHKLAMRFVVFCLPFTQVPTFKWLLRWRISEVLAWLRLPFHLAILSRLTKQMPAIIRHILLAMIGYFFYTGVIGIVHAPFLEIRVEEAMEHTIHPVLRTLLETARGFASISVFIGLLVAVRNWEEFSQIVKVFAWSGAVAGAYGVYQATVLGFRLPLPLLPGTLFHEGYARPFATFYEPTGMGSFTAVALLFSLHLIYYDRSVSGIICLSMNALGLFVSLSLAGFLGLITGMIVLILTLMWRRRDLFPSILSAASLGGALWIGYIAGIILFGEEQVFFSFSSYWLEYSLAGRAEAYSQLPSLFMEFPYGFGQGLFLFYGAGAPGFARLLLEGGIIGMVFLALFHMNSARCLIRLLRRSSEQMERLVPFLVAAYVSSLVTTVNYINTTDMWIWFVWSLPAVALWTEGQGRLLNKT